MIHQLILIQNEWEKGENKQRKSKVCNKWCQFTLVWMMNKKMIEPFSRTNEPFYSQWDFFFWKISSFSSLQICLSTFNFDLYEDQNEAYAMTNDNISKLIPSHSCNCKFFWKIVIIFSAIVYWFFVIRVLPPKVMVNRKNKKNSLLNFRIVVVIIFLFCFFFVFFQFLLKRIK